MGVREAQERIDAAEFAEWMAFDRLDPIGRWRGDYNAALVACVLANQWAGKGRRSEVGDFMPEFGGDAGEPDPADVTERVRSTFAALRERKG